MGKRNYVVSHLTPSSHKDAVVVVAPVGGDAAALEKAAEHERKGSDASSGSSSSDSSSGEPERGVYGNHCEFFLTSLGLAVGLGNIWRFPYIAYANGGATFLIPYVLMLILVGLPVFFTEMLLGQYTGTSATKVYSRMTRALRGLGYGMLTVPFITNLQYVMIMAYAMF